MSSSSLKNCHGRRLSLSMACQQVSGQEISGDIDDSDKFYLSGIQMEVDGDGKMTVKFRSKHRPTEILKAWGRLATALR